MCACACFAVCPGVVASACGCMQRYGTSTHMRCTQAYALTAHARMQMSASRLATSAAPPHARCVRQCGYTAAAPHLKHTQPHTRMCTNLPTSTLTRVRMHTHARARLAGWSLSCGTARWTPWKPLGPGTGAPTAACRSCMPMWAITSRTSAATWWVSGLGVGRAVMRPQAARSVAYHMGGRRLRGARPCLRERTCAGRKLHGNAGGFWCGLKMACVHGAWLCMWG